MNEIPRQPKSSPDDTGCRRRAEAALDAWPSSSGWQSSAYSRKRTGSSSSGGSWFRCRQRAIGTRSCAPRCTELAAPKSAGRYSTAMSSLAGALDGVNYCEPDFLLGPEGLQPDRRPARGCRRSLMEVAYSSLRFDTTVKANTVCVARRARVLGRSMHRTLVTRVHRDPSAIRLRQRGGSASQAKSLTPLLLPSVTPEARRLGHRVSIRRCCGQLNVCEPPRRL